MATPALLVVITVALATLVALALVLVALVGRLKDLTKRVAAVQERLDPELALLARETEVVQNRLSRLAEASDRPAGPPEESRVHWEERGRRR